MKPKLLLCLALVLNGHCFAAIIYPPAPDGGRQMVYTFVSKTIQATPDYLHGIHIGDVAIAEPYQSYSIGPSNLLAGKLVAAAKPGYGGGWQYLLMHGTNTVGLAYLKADEKTGNALKCYELDQSGSSVGIIQALQIARQLPQAKKQDYEVRSLDMPWILFHAVWLHGKSDDIIIPLPDNWNRWNARQSYSEAEIVKILKPEIKRDLEVGKKFDEQKQEIENTFSQAMTDYEKAHGGKCGSVSYAGLGGPFQVVDSHVQIFKLFGTTSECGALIYKVKVTYGDDGLNTVKQAEVLAKITQ